jgi:uncharacterized coiled-coil DUF342 family protein
MAINPNTDIHSYTPIRRICDYVTKALPTVFDDSLSYYEELSKILRLINQILDRIEIIEEDLTTLKNALDEVVTFVNNLDLQIQEINTAITALTTRVQALEDGFDEVSELAHSASESATAAATAAEQARAAAQSAQAAVLDIKRAFGIDEQTGESGLNGDNNTVGLDGVTGNILIDSERQDYNTDIYNIHNNVNKINSLPFNYGYCKALLSDVFLNKKIIALNEYTATSFEDFTYEYAPASGQPYYELTKTPSTTKKSIVIPTDLIEGSYIFFASNSESPIEPGHLEIAQYYQVTEGVTADKWIVDTNRTYDNTRQISHNYNTMFNYIYNTSYPVVVTKINKQEKNKPSWIVITHDNTFDLKIYVSDMTKTFTSVNDNLFLKKSNVYLGVLAQDASSTLGVSTLYYIAPINVLIPRNLIAYEIFNALADTNTSLNVTVNDVSSIVDMINGEVI